MHAVDNGPTVRLRSDAIAERLAGETVILDPDTDRYTRLNRSGSYLWETLERGPATEVDLARALAERFEILESRAREEVGAFLADLARRDLVTLEA